VLYELILVFILVFMKLPALGYLRQSELMLDGYQTDVELECCTAADGACKWVNKTCTPDFSACLNLEEG
jgi:hypothetical protein